MKLLTYLTIAVALCTALLHPLPAAAADGTPVDVALACPGGATNTATASYTTGIAQAANSALRPLAVSWAISGVAANGSIKLRKAPGGPVWATVAFTNGVGVGLLTSEWYWRRGDTLHATLSITNAATINIHALER